MLPHALCGLTLEAPMRTAPPFRTLGLLPPRPPRDGFRLASRCMRSPRTRRWDVRLASCMPPTSRPSPLACLYTCPALPGEDEDPPWLGGGASPAEARCCMYPPSLELMRLLPLLPPSTMFFFKRGAPSAEMRCGCKGSRAPPLPPPAAAAAPKRLPESLDTEEEPIPLLFRVPLLLLDLGVGKVPVMGCRWVRFRGVRGCVPVEPKGTAMRSCPARPDGCST